MSVTFDRVVVTVSDLEAAAAQYGQLFDCVLPRHQSADGTLQALLPLANTCIALEQATTETARVTGLVLCSSQHEGAERPIENALNVNIGLCNASSAVGRVPLATPVAEEVSVDHVVLRTNDAAACIDLFQVGLGVRLALDKTVEKWGGRMLFFRAGKMTLEVIASDEIEASEFWGIAYQCKDIEAFCARLKAMGVAASEIREGRKPGTLVATIKSHCLEIPTLLIQQLADH